MPRLVRLYIRHVLIGFALSAAFVALLFWLDIKGLRGLVAASDVGALAVFMLWFMNGLVFAGVQFAFAVMAMAEGSGQGPGGGRRLRLGLRARGAPLRPALVPDPGSGGAGKRRDHQTTVRF